MSKALEDGGGLDKSSKDLFTSAQRKAAVSPSDHQSP